ncbi:hypothetical protein [Romboutsia sp.]|uniref:hypothetical protein n=1 Tax=Romboutsia sp. TaxID=1965302 RepID=UPI003F3C4F56
MIIYNNVCLKFVTQVDINNPYEKIINIFVVNEDNVNETLNLEEDVSFTLTITKGIGSYFDNELIDFNCTLYEDNTELIKFKPSKNEAKLIDNNNVPKDKIEQLITIKKGANKKVIKIVSNIIKNEDEWSFDNKKINIANANYSGAALLNIQAWNPINCKLMLDDGVKKIENAIKLDIYNELPSKWPMISHYKLYNTSIENNKFYIYGTIDMTLVKYLIQKGIFSGKGRIDLDTFFEVEVKSGFKLIGLGEYYYEKYDNTTETIISFLVIGSKGVVSAAINQNYSSDLDFSNMKNFICKIELEIQEGNINTPISEVAKKLLIDMQVELSNFYQQGDQEEIGTIPGLPRYKNVKVDERVYFRGEKVPILVEFDKVMNANKRIDDKQCTLIVNNEELKPYFISDEFNASTLLFLYEVKSDSNTTLNIEKFIDGRVFNDANLDEIDFSQIPNSSPKCTLVPIRMCDAILDINPIDIVRDDKTENLPITEKIGIRINLLNDEDYKTYYINDKKYENSNISNSVYAKIIEKESNDIVADNIELHYSSDYSTLIGSCNINLNISDESKEYFVKIYARDIYLKGNTKVIGDYILVYNKTASFILSPIKYVVATDITLQIPVQGQNWPSKIDNLIYNVNEELVEIAYVYSATIPADYAREKDFVWSVVNKDTSITNQIATVTIINNKNFILPLIDNKSEEGEIIVKLTATNGNVNTIPNITVSSQPIKIAYEDKPSLIIPTVFSKIEIIDESDAKIRYIQNLTEVDTSKDVDFYCYLYNGNYKINQLQNIQPIETFNYKRSSNSYDKNEYTISKDYLTHGPSQGTTPGYTVLIKSKDPYENNKDLYAIAYIYVRAKPIKLSLDCGDKTTYIDNSDSQNNNTIVNINWKIENIDEVNGAEVLFQIDKNGKVLQESIKILENMIKQSKGTYTGTYDLELTNVPLNIPKDVYTISIKGKNVQYNETSFDSKIFNVYSANSLKILINNTDTPTYNMNNYDYLSTLNLNTLTSTEIENLRKALNLKAKASIKASTFKEYEDFISWKTSDHDKLTINYLTGNNYQDIQKTIYEYFTPSQQFLLAGLKDGQVTLSATHAQTNITDKVTINISTLKDKFYLFKFYPKTKTTINYTDSQNNKRSVTSNNEGMLALYEPNRINSSVYVKSEYNNETYLGTILKINTLSGEKDITKNMLYPINMLSLRKVAVIDIYLKNDDGTPYTKKIKVHGGVYKNDGYCQDALIEGNTGKVGAEIIASNSGHIKINMDSTQFWSRELGEVQFEELIPMDKLKFILEIYPLDENYYPTIIYIDGNENNDDIVKFGNGVVNLVRIKDNKRNTPFILNQSISYLEEDKKSVIVTDNISKIGPSDVKPKVNLNTNIMLWGIPLDTNNKYSLKCRDKQGKGQIVQNSSIVKYPFSKSAIVKSTIDLSKDKIWIGDLEKTTIEFNLYNSNVVIKSIPNPTQIINMCGIQPVEESEAVTSQLDKLKESAFISGQPQDIGDKLINIGIKMISAIGMQGQYFKMAITSTQDPSIFRIFIWAGNTDVGLNIPDNLSIVLLDELDSRGLGLMPGISDLLSMGNGTYEKEQADTLNNILNSGKKGFSNTDYSWGLGGFFLAEVEFDYDITKWGFCILGGGFSANASMEYKWTYNTMVGPVPVTAYIKAGGGIGANFNVAVRRSQLPGYPWATNYPSKKANDYITRINANIYIRAFAGIGFDFSVIALRIGIFGQIEANFETVFLSRNYLSDYQSRELNGIYLEIKGTIGIEFEVKFLFISYQTVLASVSASKEFKFNTKYDEINDYWKKNSSIASYNDFYSENSNEEFRVVSSIATIEHRNYLDKYERYWGLSKDISILNDNSLIILQQNAYPNSQPKLSNDGSILIYLSDEGSSNISDTRLCYSIRNNQGNYEQGIVIPPSINEDQTPFNGYGDCNPKIDGNKDFAVLTWVRLIESETFTPGTTLSQYEELSMLNSTEVMLSIWQNNSWNTIRVTKDTTPDLSPVVATNGDSVLLAWRNVYSNNDGNVLEFGVKDNIDFIRVNKNNLQINESYNLYNGSNGTVKGLDVAMLKNGTCCVVYVVDLSKANKESEYEIFYSIINTNNQVIKSVRLTNDEYLNENPKIATVTLKSGEEKFVIAYHTLKVDEESGLSDIRLAFIDEEGTIDVNYLEAVSEKVGPSNIELSGKYEFVKVDKKDNQIENLALMWTEAYLSIDESAIHNVDKDIIKVIKFIEDTNYNITLSAPINIYVMQDRTLIENFDCYMDNIDNLIINTVLLGTEYEKIDLNDPSTYKVVMYKENPQSEEIPVYVSDYISNLYTLSSNLRNSITVESMYVDYATVKANMEVTVLFKLKNSGLDTINNIQIEIDNQLYNFENLNLEPNYSIEIPIVYEIGEEINNAPVVITAKTVFDEIITENTTLYLDYPDVGISKVENISEANGTRKVRVTLYNETDCKLAKANRGVILKAYYEEHETPVQELTINNLQDLQAIDGGYYTTILDFNIKEYLGEGVEIPSNGVGIYINVQIYETANNKTYTLPEINMNNNYMHYNFGSLLKKYNENISISVDHEIALNQSVGYITIRNNSLNKIYGRLLAKLLDENNNLIISKVFDMDDNLNTFGSNANNNLLANEEENLSKTIFFDTEGKTITVEYYNDEIKVDPDVNETKLIVSYDFDQVPSKIRVDIKVIGAGMDNEDPIIGDTRWLPYNYKVIKEDKIGVYECYEYKTDMYLCKAYDNKISKLSNESQLNNNYTLSNDYYGKVYVNSIGKYIIYVTLEEEIYTINGWQFQERFETIEYEFTVENNN